MATKKAPQTHDFTRSYLRLKDGDEVKVIRSQTELDAYNRKQARKSETKDSK